MLLLAVENGIHLLFHFSSILHLYIEVCCHRKLELILCKIASDCSEEI